MRREQWQRRTFVRALAPKSARRRQIDGRQRAVVVRFSLDRVQPVVGRHGDEQAQERCARARCRGHRQRPMRRYTAHDVIDDVRIH